MAGSDYFEAAYTGGWADASGPHTLGAVPADALGACLDWIYTGTCVAADDSALHAILEAAIFLQIAPLIEAAREVVQRRLGPATALATWGVADLCSLEKLKTYATTTCCFHFSSLSRRQEWLSAPVALVRALLSDDRLRLRSEDEACTGLLIRALQF